MRCLTILLAAAALALVSSRTLAAEISGEYLEARTCDVYTGPCFANGEMNLAGKEALMAWKVDEGSWNNVSLSGLGVALVVNSELTMGYDGVFEMEPGEVSSVILVDKKASPAQSQALIAFVRDAAGELATDVERVDSVPFELKNDHLDGRGVFKAGDVAQIETRALTEGDCVCTNEVVFYQPLTEVENFSPAYSQTLSYQGDGLNRNWQMHGLRSAFLATFRR